MKQSRERSELVIALGKTEDDLDELRNSDEPEDIIRGKMIELRKKISSIKEAIRNSPAV